MKILNEFDTIILTEEERKDIGKGDKKRGYSGMLNFYRINNTNNKENELSYFRDTPVPKKTVKTSNDTVFTLTSWSTLISMS